MNFDRIRPSIDVDRMQRAHVTVVGGANGLTRDLVHSGLGSVTHIDFDRIEPSNAARQDFDLTDVGRYKAEALAASLKRLNPDVQVTYLVRNFCELSEEEVDQHLGQSDLLIFATDSFAAQARGNIESLRLGKPALWIGLYQGARAGEIVYYAPGITRACYRCICSGRYEAFERQARGQAAPPVNVPSTGGTIFDLHLVDAIAGQIAVGLITAGAPNRMGRLIGQLDQRNLLQVKIDPNYTLNGRDVFGEYLGHHPAQFSFNTIALPMEPEPDCPDCATLRRAAQEVTPCEQSSNDTSRATPRAGRSRSGSSA
ncbi:MAG: dinucleotide-utilizing enzyme [Phycisphaerales bacterium]|nr:dinucleotide-utilizing enzyme [Phycisphaerales bacterium]